MCGVFGFAGKFSRSEWKVAHQLLGELAVASEVRGVDAAGFAALTASGNLLWQRQPGPARELLGSSDFAALRRRSVVIAIGHTRLATTGAPAVNGNNHPHFAGDLAGETWAWALVHNGFIPTHEEKAAALRLPLRSRCDSEILVQALHRWGETEGPETCLALGGKQSVLAIHTKTRRMLAWTNGEMPLVAFRVDSLPGLWWASTEEIAQEALEAISLQARFSEAMPGFAYSMDVCDGQVVIQTTHATTVRNRRA